MSPVLFIVLSIGVSIAIIIGGTLYIISSANEKRRVERRLSSIKDRSTGGLRSAGSSVTNVRRSTSDSSVVILDRLIKQALPNREQLRHRLMRTGYKWSIGDYLIGSGVIAVIAAAITFFLFQGSILFTLCALIFCGIGLPYFLSAFLGLGAAKNSSPSFQRAST